MAYRIDPVSRDDRLAHATRHSSRSAVHARILRHSYRLQFLLAPKFGAHLYDDRPLLYPLRGRLVDRSFAEDRPRRSRARRRSRIARLRMVAVHLLGNSRVAVRSERPKQ